MKTRGSEQCVYMCRLERVFHKPGHWHMVAIGYVGWGNATGNGYEKMTATIARESGKWTGKSPPHEPTKGDPQ